MLEILGNRQKALLRLLLQNKLGLSVDQLAAQLGIARNAVRQHLTALENDGLVMKGVTRSSGGRPGQLYVLTDQGKEIFPRHYSWFAQLLLESMAAEVGSEELARRLEAIGKRVAAQLRDQLAGSDSLDRRVEKLAEIMGQIGYESISVADLDGTPMIEAGNCVFHRLAMENPDICHFDLALLSDFTGSPVKHEECMARGGNTCRFRFQSQSHEPARWQEIAGPKTRKRP